MRSGGLHFVRAAERLHIDQSLLPHTIKEMEEHLAVRRNPLCRASDSKVRGLLDQFQRSHHQNS